nr:FAD-dependent oxidoreductase [Marinitoga lauensis]
MYKPGCIPTKAMLTAAHLYTDIISKSKKFGIKVDNVTYDLKGIMKHMNKAITMSRKGIEFLMKKNKIDVFNGIGEIIDKNHVKVNDEIIEGEYLILAHGSIPSVFPPFDKVEGLWTSDDVFKMAELPESIAIIGGGVIGIEFATFFSSLGKKVYVIELADHILPFEDNDIADAVKKSLIKKGVKIFEKSKVKDVIKNENDYTVIIEGDENFEIISEKVLLAVGRKPNIPEDIRKLGWRLIEELLLVIQ